MNTGVITQARMTSERLPGKVLLPLGDTNVLGMQIRRLGATGLPLIVAIPESAESDPLAKWCQSQSLPVYRGSEEDVLQRYWGAARENDLDVVVRVTSDCPLVDPDLIIKGVEVFQSIQGPHAFVSNAMVRTFPRGFDFEIFDTGLLEMAVQQATEKRDREHVTLYIKEKLTKCAEFAHITQEVDRSSWRVTVDEDSDYRLVSELVRLGADKMNHNEICGLLEQHPELVEINRAVEQKKA